MENISNFTKYETKNGIFYCSDVIDTKTVEEFKRFNGNSLNEIEALKKFLNADSIVFDVGAHIGTFSIPLSTVCKKVYSFEPNPTNIQLIEKNIAANNRENIELIKKAVAESVKEVGFVAQTVSGQSYVDEDKTNTGMYTVTLDSLNITPDLIKLDIEGFELRALMGAENVLKSKPVLFVEYALWCLKRAGNTTEELDSFLKKHGYTSYLHIKENYFVRLSNVSQIIGKDQTSNLLCISADSSLPEGLKTISYMNYFVSKIKPLERLKRLLK